MTCQRTQRTAPGSIFARAACLLIVALSGSARPARAQTVAITNARIHTVAGPAIERGTIVFQGGRITAVGADVQPPAGARIIDGTGRTVTPGLLDSSTTLGLVEIGADDGSNDAASAEIRNAAALDVRDAINPLSTLIPVTRVEGITRVVVQPQNGAALFAGRGALIDLGGDRVDTMVRRDATAMYALLGQGGAALVGGSRAAALLRLREALQDARRFADARAARAAGAAEYSLERLDLEALQPVIRGSLPLAVTVHRASDILAVLRLARDFDLRIILMGATEGWRVAADIATAGVPVVLNPLQNIPGLENPGITLENAARLREAGVTVAFATFDAHNARNLKQVAGNAVSYGMPYDAALEAVTSVPASIWGIADRFGTLETGKDADIVVWSGDPFELSTRAEHVFIGGREIEMDSRQLELFRKYRMLPGR
jgi:imidazolonepropionase-like amidohydrolase